MTVQIYHRTCLCLGLDGLNYLWCGEWEGYAAATGNLAVSLAFRISGLGGAGGGRKIVGRVDRKDLPRYSQTGFS